MTAPITARSAQELALADGSGWAEFFRRRSANLARIDARAGGHLWCVAAVCLVFGLICSGRAARSFDPQTKAVGVSEFLMKERIAGNMFNNDEIGDYLIYRTFPTYRVLFDGRSDMYGAALMKEYYQVIRFRPGWEQVLEKYGITWIVFDTDSDFSRFLLGNGQWRLIYSDKVASVFLKNVPQYRQLIEKYRRVTPALE